MLKWIEAYLSNRTQFVNFGASSSLDFDVSSGVPQGSHLGPTLFLLFINDLPDDLREVFIAMYADDVKIAKIIKTQQDAVTLQAAIDRLKSWCDENNLHLNLDKCVVLTIGKGRNVFQQSYTYGNHVFKNVLEYKDLGVIIDSKLNFVNHIDAITAKATAALGFVKRFCSDITDTVNTTLKSLYFALVQSHLEYCSVVWQPFYDVNSKKIESILKQFSMYARREYQNEANSYHISSYMTRLADLNMSSVERRRANSCLIFMYDILHGQANCQSMREAITYNTIDNRLRRQEFVRINDKKLKLALTTPLAQMVRLSNAVPDLFRDATSRTNFISRTRAIDDSAFGALLLNNPAPN